MTGRPSQGATLSLRAVEKTWASADRRFTLNIHALDIDRGEVVALTGESGSGKSTLLEIAGLASRPDRVERFELGGTDGPTANVAALHARGEARGLARLRARRIGYVLQTGALLPFLTVTENVALPQTLAGREDPQEIALLLGRLGLRPVAKAYPAQLSVGQRQRAAIARALAHRPDLVLADEPTAALDPPNKRRVIELFLELADRLGAAVLIATHERAIFTGEQLRRIEITTSVARRGAIDHVSAELRAEAA